MARIWVTSAQAVATPAGAPVEVAPAGLAPVLMALADGAREFRQPGRGVSKLASARDESGEHVSQGLPRQVERAGGGGLDGELPGVHGQRGMGLAGERWADGAGEDSRGPQQGSWQVAGCPVPAAGALKGSGEVVHGDRLTGDLEDLPTQCRVGGSPAHDGGDLKGRDELNRLLTATEYQGAT